MPGYTQPNSSLILGNIIGLADTASLEITVAHERIYNSSSVIAFYKSIHFALAWQDGRNITSMVIAIRNAPIEGLDPKDYHIQTIEHYYNNIHVIETDRVNFDLLLTDAFLTYASHLLSGKSNPELLYSEKWEADVRRLDLVQLLQDALYELNIAETLDGLKPSYPGYKKLKNQLKYYRALEVNGGWSQIPQGVPIEVASIDERIPLIRKRLYATGQMHSLATSDSVMYDSILFKSVKLFQKQHGLKEDGVIGKHTLEVLNYRVEDYINKIKVNLERYRWLPWEFEKKYVLVNIPAFQLEVRENDSLVMTMKTIVGRPDRATPIFSSAIRYLILNPTWTVPPTILEEDVLPKLKHNLGYLKRNNLHVINKEGEEIDPSILTWDKYTKRNFPYHLQQDPGPNNSMGLIKFQFPNHHKVFLHDTNMRSLFSETYRALSSGCIRLESPFILASYLLKGTKWTSQKIDKAVSSKETTTIVFPDPVPIHLMYLTAFVDDDNVFQIRDDIYNLDQAVLAGSDFHLLQ